jgi:hypothetical protein
VRPAERRDRIPRRSVAPTGTAWRERPAPAAHSLVLEARDNKAALAVAASAPVKRRGFGRRDGEAARARVPRSSSLFLTRLCTYS